MSDAARLDTAASYMLRRGIGAQPDHVQARPAIYELLLMQSLTAAGLVSMTCTAMNDTSWQSVCQTNDFLLDCS